MQPWRVTVVHQLLNLRQKVWGLGGWRILMSTNRVTAGMLSGLICASFACAQLLQPVPPRASDPNGGRPQDIFLNQPGALEADRPRTAFERFEQSMSRA